MTVSLSDSLQQLVSSSPLYTLLYCDTQIHNMPKSHNSLSHGFIFNDIAPPPTHTHLIKSLDL